MYLLEKPKLLPDVQVFRRDIDVATHVPGSGDLLSVVMAAVGCEEGRENGGEEERLQNQLRLLSLGGLR